MPFGTVQHGWPCGPDHGGHARHRGASKKAAPRSMQPPDDTLSRGANSFCSNGARRSSPQRACRRAARHRPQWLPVLKAGARHAQYRARPVCVFAGALPELSHGHQRWHTHRPALDGMARGAAGVVQASSPAHTSHRSSRVVALPARRTRQLLQQARPCCVAEQPRVLQPVRTR